MSSLQNLFIAIFNFLEANRLFHKKIIDTPVEDINGKLLRGRVKIVEIPGGEQKKSVLIRILLKIMLWRTDFPL